MSSTKVTALPEALLPNTCAILRLMKRGLLLINFPRMSLYWRLYSRGAAVPQRRQVQWVFARCRVPSTQLRHVAHSLFEPIRCVCWVCNEISPHSSQEGFLQFWFISIQRYGEEEALCLVEIFGRWVLQRRHRRNQLWWIATCASRFPFRQIWSKSLMNGSLRKFCRDGGETSHWPARFLSPRLSILRRIVYQSYICLFTIFCSPRQLVWCKGAPPCPPAFLAVEYLYFGCTC